MSMKHLAENLLKVLKCPACAKSALQDVDGSRLICSVCGRSYPIINGIPDMLPESGALPVAGASLAQAGEKRMDID